MDEELHRELSAIQGKLDIAVELARRHDKEIYGNGKIGLKDQVYYLITMCRLAIGLSSAAAAVFVWFAREWIWRVLLK